MLRMPHGRVQRAAQARGATEDGHAALLGRGCMRLHAASSVPQALLRASWPQAVDSVINRDWEKKNKGVRHGGGGDAMLVHPPGSWWSG